LFALFSLSVLFKAVLRTQRQWAESETWTESTLQQNEWSTLPLPVFDRLLRQGFSFGDLCAIALTCTAWHAAVYEMVP
jgi:hypothetical protein